MSHADPDYILFMDVDSTALGASMRRSLAMRQWMAMRSDREYKNAARWCEDIRLIPLVVRDAWRAFWRGNADRVMRTVRVVYGARGSASVP